MLNDGNFIGFYSLGKDYGYMSNWYPAGFKYAGKSFISSEQFMMYQKMMTFGQYKIRRCKKRDQSEVFSKQGSSEESS